MSYQITATVEKFEIVNKAVKLQLKGCNGYFFEFKMDAPKTSYNILEPIDKTKQPIFLESGKYFYLNIGKDLEIITNLLSHAIMENKRLEFEIKEKTKQGTKEYSITSISKAN